MMRIGDTRNAWLSNPIRETRWNPVRQVANKKASLLEEILSSNNRVRKPNRIVDSDDVDSSPTSTLGYILFLLSSLLLLVGWLGSWVDGNSPGAAAGPPPPSGVDDFGDGIVVIRTTPVTTTTVTSTSNNEEAFSTPSYRFSKYGCSFGYQGRLCERTVIKKSA